MGRGLGPRQRALLAAVERSEAVRVVPSGSTRAEAVSGQRAARGLVRRGLARAVYRWATDARGRNAPVLHLVSADSQLVGDSWRRQSRGWVDPPPFGMLSLPARVQGPVLSHFSGIEVSVSTAARRAAEYREARRTAA